MNTTAEATVVAAGAMIANRTWTGEYAINRVWNVTPWRVSIEDAGGHLDWIDATHGVLPNNYRLASEAEIARFNALDRGWRGPID